MKSTIRNLTLAAVSTICLIVFSIIFSLLPATAFAQDTGSADANGEICVRSFEDINGNGIRDLNEAPLQGGISANLLNEQGVIIASALLDNSPTVTRGLICFQFLPAGQYTVEVVSANYQATTENTLTSIVEAGDASSVPFVMDFGAQNPAAASGNTAVPPAQADANSVLTRVLVSALGAVAVLIVMTIIGLLIYLVRYRGRIRRAEAEAVDYRRPGGATATRTTGSIPVVNVSPSTDVTDTSEFRPKS